MHSGPRGVLLLIMLVMPLNEIGNDEMSNSSSFCPVTQTIQLPADASYLNTPSLMIYFVFVVLTAIFGLLASIMSFYLMFRHFQFYYKPNYQRYIVRILLMVPIYSLTSWLSFKYTDKLVYFNVIRDCYEAFTLHSFFMLLMNYLGPTEEARHEAMQKFPDHYHPWPFHKVRFNPRGRAFMLATRQLILQYVVIRPLTTLASLLMELGGVLCYNTMSPSYGQFYITIVNLTSVCVAMYVLILFYLVVHHEIDEHKPLLKFIAIKFVVFFSFWQAIVISILSFFNVIHGNDAFTTDQITGLIDAGLVCGEMAVAAVLHIKAFSHEEFIPRNGNKVSMYVGLKDSLNPMDILSEISEAPQAVKSHNQYRRQKRLRKKKGLVPVQTGDHEVDMVPMVESPTGEGSHFAHEGEDGDDYEDGEWEEEPEDVELSRDTMNSAFQ